MFVSLSNPLISVLVFSQKPSANSKLAFPKSQISVRNPGVLVSRNGARSIRATAKKDGILRIKKIFDAIFTVTEDMKSNLGELRQLAASEEKSAGSLPIDAGVLDSSDRTLQTLELLDRSSEDLLESVTKSCRERWYRKRRDRDYKMRFDMPGLTKDDVKVWVQVNFQKKKENVLVIKGEKVAKRANGEEGEAMEWAYGKYSRRFVLPEKVEFQKIKAAVRDGVLYVSIPKTAKSGSEVKTAESGSEVETNESSSEVWDINVE